MTTPLPCCQPEVSYISRSNKAHNTVFLAAPRPKPFSGSAAQISHPLEALEISLPLPLTLTAFQNLTISFFIFWLCGFLIFCLTPCPLRGERNVYMFLYKEVSILSPFPTCLRETELHAAQHWWIRTRCRDTAHSLMPELIIRLYRVLPLQLPLFPFLLTRANVNHVCTRLIQGQVLGCFSLQI